MAWMHTSCCRITAIDCMATSCWQFTVEKRLFEYTFRSLSTKCLNDTLEICLWNSTSNVNVYWSSNIISTIIHFCNENDQSKTCQCSGLFQNFLLVVRMSIFFVFVSVFSVLVSFHENPWITGLRGKGKTISWSSSSRRRRRRRRNLYL